MYLFSFLTSTPDASLRQKNKELKRPNSSECERQADTGRCQGNIIPLLFLTSSSLDGNHKILSAKLWKISLQR